jgi:hypothetical protein
MTNQNASLLLPAVREDRGRFASLRNERALIYWPHGFGDWVTFGGVAPLLEPSNAYAITRFGDDYVSVMEGNEYAEPLFSGVPTPGDGSEFGAPHLGLALRRCDGRRVRVDLPAPLATRVQAFRPSVLLWTDYPETEGRTAYPFHTKARNLARLLVPAERLASFDLARPLKSALDFTPAPEIAQLVDARLAQFAPPGTRLGVISRSGVTAARKNWGAPEAQAFVAAMARAPGNWRFITMDGEDLGAGVAGFQTLFGDLGEPFARVYKGVAARTDLFVGIPAGPLHFALARGGAPTVGLWLAHHPDWYDEPNPDAIHLVGRYVRDRGFDRRPATTTKPASLQHRMQYLDTHAISAEAVVEAARRVIA